MILHSGQSGRKKMKIQRLLALGFLLFVPCGKQRFPQDAREWK